MTNEERLYRRLERSFLVGGVALLLPLSTFAVGACRDLPPAGSSGNCCTEVEWTASADLAKAYATEDAGEAIGCPKNVRRTDTPTAPDAGAMPYGSLNLLEGPTQKLRADSGDSSCVYLSYRCCPGGRPLYAETTRGRAVVAPRARGTRWSEKADELGALGTSLDAATRDAIARGWLEDAFAEHASVASFARATLELLAVGAPPRLLAAHQRAGMQEIRHAERCFALARAYGAGAIDPGSMAVPPPRTATLARLASDLFVEGCVAETIGALLAARALDGCTVPAARETLRIIAADEAAHAALAWKTLAWAMNEGGQEVVGLVLERARQARAELAHAERSSSDLRAHGRLDEAEIARVTRDAWNLVIAPLLKVS